MTSVKQTSWYDWSTGGHPVPATIGGAIINSSGAGGLTKTGNGIFTNRSGYLTTNGGRVSMNGLGNQEVRGAGDFLRRVGGKKLEVLAVDRVPHDVALAEHFPAEAHWTVPEGGFFVWVEMPSFLDLKSILAEAVERGVTYVPGDAFFPDGRGRNCMRLAFCYVEPEKIREGIARLAEVLEDRLELYRAFAAAGVLPAATADERG